MPGPTDPPRRGLLLPALLLPALAMVAPGCFQIDLDDLAKEPPVKRRYLLDVDVKVDVDVDVDVPAADRSVAGPVLLVEQAHAVSPYNGRSFVYRIGDHVHSTDFYNEFLVAPAEQVSQIARRWLRAAGGFSAVVDPDSRLIADQVLSIDVTDLRGDYRVAEEPSAVFAMRAVVLHVVAPEEKPRIVLQREYAASIRVADTSAGALVAGWNRCLVQVLTALTEDLRKAGR